MIPNTTTARRLWLLYRYDAAAGAALIVFMVTAFWAAGQVSAVLGAL